MLHLKKNSSHTIHHMQICHSLPSQLAIPTTPAWWLFWDSVNATSRLYICWICDRAICLWHELHRNSGTLISQVVNDSLVILHVYPLLTGSSPSVSLNSLFLVSCNPIVTRYSWWSNIPHIYPSIFGLTSTAEHNDMSLLINPYLVCNNFPLFLLC